MLNTDNIFSKFVDSKLEQIDVKYNYRQTKLQECFQKELQELHDQQKTEQNEFKRKLDISMLKTVKEMEESDQLPSTTFSSIINSFWSLFLKPKADPSPPPSYEHL